MQRPPTTTAATRRIRIRAGQVEATATLGASPTAEAIWEALPLQATANRWGEEIYFEIPVRCAAEPDARDVVQAGEIAYWPPGAAFCIFFGPTPASRGDEIRAASPVNVVGRIEGDPGVFARVRGGTRISLQRES
ncbi:MAG: cyclophilin-like fold protein [Armatimonadota bacterium]|nr:cyclophilin-like fold protein [Armatimonadota bacterium]MDR7428389.1 cyclophilin-like fold protein [Armatimonadota bacterium]MDR7465197.1 cyclophilin-like fold protein [Armatimonadota bacterium]MDR7469815.1 cyclophilin-like fold protein [Armatimonadota bacterium]MDR7475968.1 cyclophilin-like fold protein [Armatimonadota bacterium]